MVSADRKKDACTVFLLSTIYRLWAAAQTVDWGCDNARISEPELATILSVLGLEASNASKIVQSFEPGCETWASHAMLTHVFNFFLSVCMGVQSCLILFTLCRNASCWFGMILPRNYPSWCPDFVALWRLGRAYEWWERPSCHCLLATFQYWGVQPRKQIPHFGNPGATLPEKTQGFGA